MAGDSPAAKTENFAGKEERLREKLKRKTEDRKRADASSSNQGEKPPHRSQEASSSKEKCQEISGKSWFSIALILFTISLIFLFLIIDTWNDQRRLRSFFGLIVFVFLAVMFSNNPARIRYVIFQGFFFSGKIRELLTQPITIFTVGDV